MKETKVDTPEMEKTVLERLIHLEERVNTIEGALMKQIQNFENHSHNGLGIAVIPPSRA